MRFKDITYFCNMKRLSTFALLLFLSTTAVLAQDIRAYFNKEANQAYYVHEVQPKETLYGITKTYGAHIKELADLNDLESTALHLNQKLFIPFNNEVIQYVKPKDGKKYAAVYYKVKRKETLFRICRQYFKLNLTAIKDINRLKRNGLRTNQRLLLGYLPIYPKLLNGEQIQEQTDPMVPPPVVVIESPNIETSQPTRDTIYEDLSAFAVKEEKGAAFWNKEMSYSSGYFVLHRYAEKNTWLEVTNEMYGNSVRAKVIGNIPANGYPNDVLVVVSPAIAKDLGALDARFYVKVRYLSAQPQPTSSK